VSALASAKKIRLLHACWLALPRNADENKQNSLHAEHAGCYLWDFYNTVSVDFFGR
jgi:hypothetical protein